MQTFDGYRLRESFSDKDIIENSLDGDCGSLIVKIEEPEDNEVFLCCPVPDVNSIFVMTQDEDYCYNYFSLECDQEQREIINTFFERMFVKYGID